LVDFKKMRGHSRDNLKAASMTIGERLEEARKRKGISIREVAEATKIRSDYIMSMEDNSMEIPLPEIYKRGFLRNYARFLKLDPDKMLTDYIAQKKGRVLHRDRPQGHDDREVFGRMELDEDEYEPTTPSDSRQSATNPHGHDEVQRSNPTNHTALLTDNTLYLKIAAGLMGVVLVVFLVFVIVNLLRGDEEAVADTPASGTTQPVVNDGPIASSTDPGTTTAATGPSTIILRAKGEDVTLIVDDTVTRERLFRGILRAGEVQLLEREGRVDVRFDPGSALEIELADGTVVRPSTPGMGRTQLD